MPLNYEPIRQRIAEYQSRPTKAAALRLEREIETILQLKEGENIYKFEWVINEIDYWWSEVLTYLSFNKSVHASDEVIGALIDILNERNLLPNESLFHSI